MAVEAVHAESQAQTIRVYGMANYGIGDVVQLEAVQQQAVS